VAPSDGTGGDGHQREHEGSPVNIRKHFCRCVGDGALAEVAQGVCGVSILGDAQKTRSWAAGGGGPCLSWEGLDELQRLLTGCASMTIIA